MDYRVIKENDLFLLTNAEGNIPQDHPYGLGLYKKDTRFLSKLDLRINGKEPTLLYSDAGENYMAKILLTNPHMDGEDGPVLWRESVEIERERFIHQDVLYETINLKNYFPKPVRFELSIHFEADFADMFIVRGFQRGKVGKRTGQTSGEKSIAFHYEGADRVPRATKVSWDKPARKVTDAGDVIFDFSLAPSEEKAVTFLIRPEIGEAVPEVVNKKEEAFKKLKASYEAWDQNVTRVTTDYNPLQQLVDRGINDLRVLLTDIGFGKFPVAGLPWFGVPFGRDSLITALQMLAFQPEVARGTLLTLADQQGKQVNPWRDEQPGKILHEIRYGELAATNQIPFAPYYGTIDATPLFLILLTEYVKWTGDMELAVRLEKNIEAALAWIDEFGDRDGDLFAEYHQESSKGIENQGWKDSGDSIVHRNGEYAETPIALVEVQGYIYQAKKGIADIFDRLGKPEKAGELREQAQLLKAAFEEAFWMDDVKFYAIALDKNKNQVGTITSNPGHVLLAEMLEDDKKAAVIDMLLSPKMFSGFGIRTMGEGEAGYNPMSYHDGSVWPHDNSLAILGMSKAGHPQAALTVIRGLIQASAHFEYDRLPELFCGYDQSFGKPVKYQVACSPQAWAAGTPLVFIQAMLGIFPNSFKKEITLAPVLLDEMNELTVKNMSIGEGLLSLAVTRSNHRIAVEVSKNTTGYQLHIMQPAEMKR